MSTNHTPNFNLCQWEATDKVLRADFNEDNQKIDAALAEILARVPRFATGTYVGTDEHGANHPNTLTFDFKPYVVICYDRSNYRCPALFIRGESRFLMEYGSGYAAQQLTWGENSVSWYCSEDENRQLNSRDFTYRYLAFGW